MSNNKFEESEYFRQFADFAATAHQGGKAATELLLSQAHLNSTSRVLEIACGSGNSLQLLEAKDLGDLHAIDISGKVLGSVRERGISKKASLKQADVHALPYKSNSFDVVLVESVLVFCDVETALREIYRVMKPHALLLLNETFALEPTIIPHAIKLKEKGRFPIFSPYIQADWENFFLKTGFDIQWQRIEALNPLKMLMLLQLMEIPQFFDGRDLIAYGLWTLTKK